MQFTVHCHFDTTMRPLKLQFLVIYLCRFSVISVILIVFQYVRWCSLQKGRRAPYTSNPIRKLYVFECRLTALLSISYALYFSDLILLNLPELLGNVRSSRRHRVGCLTVMYIRPLIWLPSESKPARPVAS